MRFSPSTLGWYPEFINYQNLPSDVVTVSDSLYQSLRHKCIVVDSDGYPHEKPAQAITFQERAAYMLSRVDAHIDAAAKAKGYDNRITFYMRSGVPESPYYEEGLAFALWMDTCYEKCIQIMGLVQSGEMDEPNETTLLGLLPILELPE